MTQLAVRQSQELSQVGNWTEDDIQLIRQIAAKNATDAEFKLLLYLAKQYNLDPLAKQIWCVKYGTEAAQIYAGRDGFVKIAHDSGLLDGFESDEVYDDKGNLIGATCIVWRKDMSHPFKTRVALKEYTTGKNQWAAKPGTMIKKVAESQCLRKAFPVSGLYAQEEMSENELPTSRQEVVNRETGEIVTTSAKAIEPPKQDKPKQQRKLTVEERDYRAGLDLMLIQKGIIKVNTIDLDTYQFSPITLDQFNAAVAKLTGTPNAGFAMKKYGLEGNLSDLVAKEYKGEGLTWEQKLSAGLHILWGLEQQHQSAQQQEPEAEEESTEQDEWDLFGQPVAAKA